MRDARTEPTDDDDILASRFSVFGWWKDPPRPWRCDSPSERAVENRDHAIRYRDLVDELTENGLVVYAYDHRGHVASGGDRQRFDSIDELVADIDLEVRAVAAEHAGLPLFLYGHSLFN